MERIKNSSQIRITLTVLGIHAIITVLMLLMYGSGHPLLGLMRNWPVGLKMFASAIVAFILYAIPGYMLVISKGDRKTLIACLDKAILTLGGILLALFIGIYIYSFITYDLSAWYIYSLVNPVFGNVMYSTMARDFISFVWVISAIIPGLGLSFGMFLRLKQEGIY